VRFPLFYGLVLAAPMLLLGGIHAAAGAGRGSGEEGPAPVAAATHENVTLVKPVGVSALAARAQQIQASVDALRIRLAIPEAVVVSVVPKNDLLVSVAPMKDGGHAFGLAVDDAFLDTLTHDELDAVVAHELGHVWIFTHHPYLQTEELANDVALRVVERASLERAYEKAWQQAGRKGDLVYLPAK
jgi:Zn-dependent protease with chaperone function